ncbi:MAG: glycosyltransferase [Sciscionella sp.]
MKIAFVTETWLPSTDGVVTRLAATVRELRGAGHQVLIIAPNGSHTDISGATVRGVPTIGFRRIYDGKRWGLPLPRVGRYLREFQPDVVHVVNPVLLGIAGVIAACRQGLPLVASYHTDVARYAGYYRLGWLGPVIWALLRQLHGRAQLNLATSAATSAELAARGIERVRLWPRGVDLELFRPDPLPEAARDSGKPVALFVGRLAAEKALPRLRVLADPENGFQLAFVGDGPQRAELQRRFSADTVTFTGILHGDTLAEAYRDADLFVFPSSTETLGLVLLEALASGLPVLAADSPASREILGGCAASRLFPPDKPEDVPVLARELLASAPRDALALAARRHAEHWSWHASTSTLLGYYDEAIADGMPPRGGRTRWQLPAFLGVGLLNAVIDVVVFNALLLVAPTESVMRLALYNTVAVVAAIVNSYWWNSRWTFRRERATGGRPLAWQRTTFLLQAVLNIVINDLVLTTVTMVLAGAVMLPVWLNTNLAKALAMASSSMFSFVIMKLLVFPARRSSQRQAMRR